MNIQGNAISNNYATTVEKLAQGQTRAGATAKAMGLEFNELNAIIGTVTAATKQSGNEVGNFVKAALPRLLSEKGQDILGSLGVSTEDGNGQLRNTIDIYTDVAKAMKDLSEAEQINVVKGLGGVYHQTRLQVLLDDLGSVDSMYRSMLETAENSEGSAMIENEKYMQSFEARINLLRVELEKLIVVVGEAFLTDGMLAFIQMAGNVLNIIAEITKTFGALPVMLGVGAVALTGLSKRFRDLTMSIFTSTKSLLSNDVATRKLTVTTAKYNTLKGMSNSVNIANNATLRANSAQMAVLTATTQTATVATSRFGSALKGLALATGAGIGFVAVGFILEKLIGSMGGAIKQSDELASANKILLESYSNNEAEIDSLAVKYSELEKEMNKANPDSEKVAEYHDVMNQLGNLLPDLVTGEDQFGNKIIASSTATEIRIELLKEQLEIQKKLNAEQERADTLESIDVNSEAIEDAQKKTEDYIKMLTNMLTGVTTKDLSSKYVIEFTNEDGEPIFKTAEDVAKLIDKLKANLDKATNNGDTKDIAILNSQISQTERYYAMINRETSGVSNNISILKSKYIDLISQTVAGAENMSDSTKSYADSFVASMLKISKGADIDTLGEGLNKLLSSDNSSSYVSNIVSNISKEFNKLNTATEETFGSMSTSVQSFIDKLPQSLSNSGLSDAEIKAIQSALQSMLNSSTADFYSLEDVMKSTGVTFEQARMNAEAVGEGMSDMGDSAQKAERDIKTLTDSISNINGILEDYAESNQLSASTIMEIIEEYPQLLAFVNDEARLIEELTKIRDQDIDAAQKQLADKIDASEDYYNANLKMIESYFKEHFKFYNGDLKNFQTLAKAKADVEKKLIEYLAKEWGSYYDTVSGSFIPAMGATVEPNQPHHLPAGDVSDYPNLDEFNKKANEANKAMQNMKKELDNFTTSQIDLDLSSIGTSIDKNTKSTEKANEKTKESVFLINELEDGIKELTRAIEQQNNRQERLLRGSDKWIKSMKEENKLLEEKRKALLAQVEAMDKATARGDVLNPTGVSTSNSITSASGTYTGKYASEINQAASKYGVNPFLIASMIQSESSFNPNARSGAGAMGLMQLMPATAKELGVKNAYDPLDNIMGGTKYIAQQIEKFGGDIKQALWAYNAGAGNVSKILNSGANSWTGAKSYASEIIGRLGTTSNSASSKTDNSHAANYYLDNFKISDGFNKDRGGGRIHKGVDYNLNGTSGNGDLGTAIKSIVAGEVVKVLNNHSGAGNAIQIKGVDGKLYEYNHLQYKPNLKVGQSVSAGQEVGKMGNTGSSTAAHLDLKIKDESGAYIDPHQYLKNLASGVISVSSSDYAKYQQDLYNQGQSALDTRDQADALLNQQMKNQEEIFQAQLDNRQNRIERLNNLIQEQQNIANSNPEGSPLRNKANNNIEYYKNQIDKEYNGIQYLANKFANTTLKITEGGRAEFAKQAEEARLERQNVTLQMAENTAQEIQEKQTQLGNLIQQQDNSISQLSKNRDNLTLSSAEYGESLEQEAKHLKEKNRLLGRQSEELKKAVKDEKITNASREEFKQQLAEVNMELDDNTQLLKENNLEMLNHRLEAYNEKREIPTNGIELLRAEMELLDDDTIEFADSLNDIIVELREIQALNQGELIDLESAINSGIYTGKVLDELKDRYQALKLTIQETNTEIRDTFYQASEVKFNINDKAIGESQKQIDFLSWQLDLLDEEEHEIKIKIYTEMQTNIQDAIGKIDKGISDALVDRTLASSRGYSTAIYDSKIEDYVSQRRNQLGEMQSIKNSMDSMVASAFDKIAQAESNAYNEASKAIDRAISESEKRIDAFSKVIARLDKQLETLQESDFTKKTLIIEGQLTKTKEMVNAIIAEYDVVASTPVYNEEQQATVEAKLEDLKVQLDDANSSILEYTRTLEQTHFDSIVYGARKASEEIERLNNKLNKNLQLLDGGMLSGTELDFSTVSMTGKTLDLGSLISNPLTEKQAQVQIQDIRNSSYGQQIRDAEAFHAQMQAQAAQFQKIMAEEQKKFEENLQLLMKLSAENKEKEKKKEADALNKITETMTKEEFEELKNHYMSLQTTMSNLMNSFKGEYSSIWSSVVAELQANLAMMETAIANAKITPSSKTPASPSKPATEKPKKYATGTKGHQGGLAIVGDRYGRELIVYPDGSIGLSNDTDQLVNLPKGTHVIPNKETEKILSGQNIPKYANGTKWDMDRLTKDDAYWMEYLKENSPKGYNTAMDEVNGFGGDNYYRDRDGVLIDKTTGAVVNTSIHNNYAPTLTADNQFYEGDTVNYGSNPSVDYTGNPNGNFNVSTTGSYYLNGGNIGGIKNGYSPSGEFLALKDEITRITELAKSVWDGKVDGNYNNLMRQLNDLRAEQIDTVLKELGEGASLAQLESIIGSKIQNQHFEKYRENYTPEDGVSQLNNTWEHDFAARNNKEHYKFVVDYMNGKSDSPIAKSLKEWIDSQSDTYKEKFLQDMKAGIVSVDEYFEKRQTGWSPTNNASGNSEFVSSEFAGVLDTAYKDFTNGQIAKETEQDTITHVKNLASSKAVTYSDAFIKKYNPYAKEGSNYAKSRESSINEISNMQSNLNNLIESNGSQTSISALVDDIISKQDELNKRDSLFIIESLDDLAQQRAKIAKETRDQLAQELEKGLLDGLLTEDAVNYYREEISNLDNQMADSVLERKGLYEQGFNIEQAYREKELMPYLDKIDDLQFEKDMLDEDDKSGRLRLENEIIEQQKLYIQGLASQKAELQDLLKTQEVGTYEWNQTNGALKEVSETIEDANLALKGMKKEVENSANGIIDTIKKGLEKQRDLEVAELEKRLDKLNDVYKSKMDAIGDRESERDFNREKQDKEVEIADLEKQLNVLSLDDSQGAIAKRLDLQKQLKEKREELVELEYKRGVELEKKAIEDSQKLQEEAINKEIEDTRWKYDEMIANEQMFSKIRQDILNGNLAYSSNLLNGFLSTFTEYNKMTAKELGQSFQGLLNLIDEVADAYNNLYSINANKPDANGVISGGGIIINRPISGSPAKAPSAPRIDPPKSDFKFKNGGLTSSTGMHWLDGTLAKPEIVLNANDTGNLLDVIKMTRDLIPKLPKIKLPNISNLLNPQSANTSEYNLTLNIDNLNGTQKDANNMATTIMQSLKKMGH